MSLPTLTFFITDYSYTHTLPTVATSWGEEAGRGKIRVED